MESNTDRMRRDAKWKETRLQRWYEKEKNSWKKLNDVLVSLLAAFERTRPHGGKHNDVFRENQSFAANVAHFRWYANEFQYSVWVWKRWRYFYLLLRQAWSFNNIHTHTYKQMWNIQSTAIELISTYAKALCECEFYFIFAMILH